MCFLCQKGNIKICDRATKLDALGNFVPLYFSLTWTFLLPLSPGAVVVLENTVFQITNYILQIIYLYKLQQFCVLIVLYMLVCKCNPFYDLACAHV